MANTQEATELVILEGQQKALSSLKDISSMFARKKALTLEIEALRASMADVKTRHNAKHMPSTDPDDEGFIGFFVFKKEEAATKNLYIVRKSDGKTFYPADYFVYEVDEDATATFRDEYKKLYVELNAKRTELSSMERELKDADDFLNFADKAGRVADTFNKLKRIK